MSIHFIKHAEIGYRFLDELAVELGDSGNTERAGRLLRSIFRLLRNHLSVEESFLIIAQMPMALKALYVDGWIPGNQLAANNTFSNFIDDVLEVDGCFSWVYSPGTNEVPLAIQAVLKTLRNYVPEEEFENMSTLFPLDIKSIMPRRDSRDLIIELINGI